MYNEDSDPLIDKPDILIWPYTDNEKVTVKSVYHRLRETHEGRSTDLDRHGRRATSIWNAVWKANIVLKVKSFMWKLLSNSLAVMKNLQC